MKRSLYIFLITLIAASVFSGCRNSDDSTDDETADTTEQVAEDDISDYSVLSYNELEVLAYEGDAEAQYRLAQMLEYGTDDVKQDFQEAFNWYQEASDNGYIDATNALGYFYLTGTYVDKDLEQAQALFSTALEGGSVNANVGLGRVILAGLSTEELEDAAIPAAVVDDTSDSDTVLDDATDTTDSTDDSSTTESDTDSVMDEDVVDNSVLQSVSTAYIYFATAAQNGDLDGMYYVGYCNENGYGVATDYVLALDYYMNAAASTSTELDDQFAINHSNTAIALMYINGSGVEVDVENAIGYLEKASDNGYAKASYYLGQIYENGLDVDQDYEKAMDYYLKAADSDYAPALNQIGYMYYNGLGVDVDFSSAVYYQKLAALQGYAKAQINLGFLYENGYGVERNLETALSYYEMAADADYEGAMEAVVRVKAQINEES